MRYLLTGALLMLVTACGTVRDVDAICIGVEPEIVALAALEAEMTDAVAVQTDRLISAIDAGCLP